MITLATPLAFLSAARPAIAQDQPSPSAVSQPPDWRRVKPPKVRSAEPPIHPDRGPGKDYSGKVRVDLIVEADGKPSHLRIARSSGYPDVDQAALDSVEKFRFRPATLDGKPVRVDMNIEVAFDRY